LSGAARRREWRSCRRKTVYPTVEAAETHIPHDQYVYACRYADHFHRATMRRGPAGDPFVLDAELSARNEAVARGVIERIWHW
jgi:hypothetical protein